MNEHEYYEIETLLNEAKPEADQSFYLLLRHQVINAVEPQKPSWRVKFSIFAEVRIWQPVLGGVLLLFLFLALTPAGQTLAQQILEFGIFYVTDNPSLAEQHIDNPPLEEESILLESVKISIAEASTQAGFTVYYPSYIPAGYEPENDPPVNVIFSSDGSVDSVDAMFTTAAEDGPILFYAQHPFPTDKTLALMPLDAGEATVEAITVLGNEALWLADHVWGTEPVGDDPTELQPVLYNVLIWTQQNRDGGNFYFWLGSEAQLSQAEMLKIAESMVTE